MMTTTMMTMMMATIYDDDDDDDDDDQPALQVVHTHGCLAVLQAKLETEMMTLLTGAQVENFFPKKWGNDSCQVLSLLVLLVSLICLVVSLCTGLTKPNVIWHSIFD